MKRCFDVLGFLASLTCFLLVCTLTCHANARNASHIRHSATPSDAPPPIAWRFGNTLVKIYYGSPVIYTIKDSVLDGYTTPTNSDGMQFEVIVNRNDAVDNKYVKVAGATQTIHFRSSDSNVIAVDDGGGVDIAGPGDCIVTISLAGRTAAIPFKVVALPLKTRMSKTDVVRVMGLPDRRTEAFLEWPTKDNTLDGIWASNEGDDVKSLYIEHWFYNHHPRAILDFEDGSLYSCLESSWDPIGMLDREQKS